MEILYLAYARLPTEKAHGLQIMKTCEALARHGAHLTLVIPGRKNAITEDVFSYYDVEKIFEVVNLNTPDWVRWGAIGWGGAAIIFSEAAKWMHRFWTADVVYSRDALILLQYILLGRKLVYEAHTAPTWVSTFVARRAYRVITISQGLKDAYITRGVSEKQLVVAHDAIDPAPFASMPTGYEARAALGIPEGRTALYVGRIEYGKGAETFAAASEHTKVRVVLIGAGSAKDELVRRYPKALFLPETKYRDLPRVLAAGDVLVIPNSNRTSDSSTYTSPLKAFAYLAARKPIVATRVPALVEIFGTAVQYAQPDSPESLAAAIDQAESVPTMLPYTWDERARAILSVL